MAEATNYGGLCSTCASAPTCTFPRDPARPVLQCEELDKASTIWPSTKTVGLNGGASFYRAISSEAASKHGYNSHLVIIDELHAQPNRELVDVLMTSTGSRRQPLVLHITTADFDRP